MSAKSILLQLLIGAARTAKVNQARRSST